jgi:hypothetical protein
MKNLKKLSIGLFAALSLTEIACPNYNRSRSRSFKNQNEEQKEGAFFAGRELSSHRQQENEDGNETNEYYEEPEQVETQSLDDQNDQNEYSLDQDDQDSLMNDSDEQAPDANYAAEENYADDAVVQIQSFGDGSHLSKLTPEQQQFIKGRLLEKMHNKNNGNKNNGNNSEDENNSSEKPSDQNVQTQSIDDEEYFDDENNDKEFMQDNDYAMIQALEDQDEQTPEQSAEKLVQKEHQVQADLAQAAQAATNLVQATEQEEQAALPAKPVEISIEQTVAAQPELLHEQSAQTVVQSPVVAQPALLQEQPAQPAAIEIVKIIKVYPVYDAVLSAVASVKAAAYDMINYAYSYFSSRR